MKWMPEEWAGVFALEMPVLELLVRATVLYFGILILMRVMPRRTGGELATMDLIFVVLIAQAAAHALGDYASVADGVLVIGFLMGWNYLLNMLSYKVPLIERLVSSPPLQVVREGRMLRRNMRRELVTEDELMSHLRQQGIDDIRDVKSAWIEGEGQLTAVRRDGGATGGGQRERLE